MVYTNDITNPIYKFEFERTSTPEYLYNVKITYSNKPEATTVDFDLSNGYLSINGQIVSIGIRPESASKAYPGDDLILQFGIGSQFGEILSAEKDYVAVYDKKMLWRANLYIEKNEAQLGGIDWNDAHPWNVRPVKDDDNFADPWWWDGGSNGVTASVRWGYNEWNRKVEDFDVTSPIFKGLNELPFGDGTQVVSLQEFTPIRTIGGSMANPEKNYIKGTVAYSYPEHSKENGLGDSGSMDSPFDYVKKLMYQAKQLNKWYATSSSETRNTVETSLSSDHWNNKVTAPLNSWYMYERSSTSDTDNKIFIPSYGLRLLSSDFAQNVIVNKDKRTYSTVVSDYLGNSSYTYVNSKNETVTVNRRAGTDNIIEAGTDCLGFASRAASYSGNKYKWFDVPKGWTEYSSGNGTNKISDVLNNYGQWPNANGSLDKDEGTRTYPWANVDGKGDAETHSYNIFTTREKIESNGSAKYDNEGFVNIDDEDVKEGLAKENAPHLLKIVPGDIFVKCSEEGKSTTNNEMDSHIAIVAYVPENADEMTVEQLLNSIVLIEAEFSWRVQSVIKTFTLGDYQNTNIKNRILELYKDMYSNADCIEYSGDNSKITDLTKFNLNNRHFAIRRLICN